MTLTLHPEAPANTQVSSLALKCKPSPHSLTIDCSLPLSHSKYLLQYRECGNVAAVPLHFGEFLADGNANAFASKFNKKISHKIGIAKMENRRLNSMLFTETFGCLMCTHHQNCHRWIDDLKFITLNIIWTAIESLDYNFIWQWFLQSVGWLFSFHWYLLLLIESFWLQRIWQLRLHHIEVLME